MKPIQTGNATVITLSTLIAIYSLSVVKSIPGLAVSPILGQLETVFKGASQLKIQMLESLPSLIIIPFILIAGRLSVTFDNRKLLLIGLGIFFVSSVLYLLPVGLDFMLFNSVLLGVGAGIVIPLSTGLVAQLFSGAYRTRQLGIISAISNLSLVGATALAGYLAGIDWHLSFLVYCLSAISLYYTIRMKLPKREYTPDEEQLEQSNKLTSSSFTVLGFKTNLPLTLMAFYFFITCIALTIPFNLAILMSRYGTASVDEVGNLISVFFLAITLPGFFVNRFLKYSRVRNNIVALAAMTLGSVMFVISHEQWAAWIGVSLVGLSYGLMQPLVYDRTSNTTTPRNVTYVLALVVTMNYVAIIFYPFFQQLLEQIFGTTDPYLSFVATAVIVGGYTIYYYVTNRAKINVP